MSEANTIRDALDARETAEMYLGQNKHNLDGTDAQILARQTLAALDRLEANLAVTSTARDKALRDARAWEARAVAAEKALSEARELLREWLTQDPFGHHWAEYEGRVRASLDAKEGT